MVIDACEYKNDDDDNAILIMMDRRFLDLKLWKIECKAVGN